MGDAAQRLGDKLLSHESLTQAQIKQAIKEARAERAANLVRIRIRKAALEFPLILKIYEDDRMLREARRVLLDLQEIIGEEPESHE